MDLYRGERYKKKVRIDLPTDSNKSISPNLNLINTNPEKTMNPFLTHPSEWNTTCTLPNSDDCEACIFASARPTSLLSGSTNRRSKTNGPFPSLGSLAHSTSDACPTLVFDWAVRFKAATLERKIKVNSRKLKPKTSIGVIIVMISIIK